MAVEMFHVGSPCDFIFPVDGNATNPLSVTTEVGVAGSTEGGLGRRVGGNPSLAVKGEETVRGWKRLGSAPLDLVSGLRPVRRILHRGW